MLQRITAFNQEQRTMQQATVDQQLEQLDEVGYTFIPAFLSATQLRQVNAPCTTRCWAATGA